MKHRKIRLLIYFIVILAGIFIYTLGSLLLKSDLLQSLGTELTAAGFIAILLELILREEFLDVIKKELQTPIKELGTGHEVPQIFANTFKNSKDRIDIVALSFTMGIQSYYDLLIDKINHEYCNIRILILDPDSPLIKFRARDEPDRNPNRISEKINQSISCFKKLESIYKESYKTKGPAKGSIRVKTHLSIPYFACSIMDNFCFITPYLSFEYGLNSPVIEIRESNSQLFHKFEKHFDVLWEREDSKLIIDIGYFGLPENTKNM